jgi:NAD(P)-dependent dehydrogenase (short-subunit alcohol dehydrogenase family)
MRLAVTGSTKLAGAIVQRFNADSIRVEQEVSKSEYDVFINNAHVDFEQCRLLKEWSDAWFNDPSKLIINISSRAGLPNLSRGYMYGAQKAALDHLADNLTYNSEKKCKITTVNLGMLEDPLSSLTYDEVCDSLEYIINLPVHIEIPRIFLQHSHNYADVQRLKAKRINTIKKDSM